MPARHHAVTILPASDMDQSEAFYRKLGFSVESDYGQYRILSDGKGWHLHLNHVAGWPKRIEDNPVGLYLYVDDVDSIADRVRNQIIEAGDPKVKPWGCYEFSISDPNGTLIRVGRIVD